MTAHKPCPASCGGVAAVSVFKNDGEPQDCRVIDELRLLFDISYTLESSLELREVIRPVLAKMSEVLGMRRGAITIRHRGQVTISETIGLPKEVSKENYLTACHQVIAVVTETGQAVVVPDISREPTLAERWREEAPRPGAADSPLAFLCVPIKFGEEVIGCLSAERVVAHFPNLSADRRLLSLIANIIAQVVHFHLATDEKIAALRDENERLQKQIQTAMRPAFIVGNSNAMRSVYLHIEEVAGSITTVLIRGESGVGKELVARALHEQSPRKSRTFVKFNCAALPESIIESELFGHEKGAFTGALALRKGRFESAAGGTIFLDEIGDVSPQTQVKLLRVLQEKEFERVGGQSPIHADVRIIAATSRDLESMIEDGKFRSDLYYRLNVFPVFVPPLRERKSDILLLADHFIEKYARANGKSVKRVSTAAIDLLMSYHWPGNVRELENSMERAVLLSHGPSIEAHHLPPTLQKKDPAETAAAAGSLDAAVSAREFEMIVGELKNSDGNMAAAARRLGLTERQMGLRIKRYGIDFKRFRREESTPSAPPG